MPKYQMINEPDVIVEAVQFDPQKKPWPEYIVPHPPNCKPKDMTWGYIETSDGRFHVAASDYIFDDCFGDKRVIHREQFEEAYRPVLVIGEKKNYYLVVVDRGDGEKTLIHEGNGIYNVYVRIGMMAMSTGIDKITVYRDSEKYRIYGKIEE